MASPRRSTIARAHQLASRCVSIAIGMLTPGFLGYWADSQLGTTPALLLIGFAFGFAYGLWRLTMLGQAPQSRTPQSDANTTNDEQL